MNYKKIIKKPYFGFSLLFSVFLLNIFIGKLSLVISGGSQHWSLDGIYEFLLLFCACMFFVSDIIKSEKLP